jgi:hypothetical protein
MNLIKRQTAPSQVGWIAPPAFEYEVFDTRMDIDRLDQFINAKAAQGWRVHTCQCLESADHTRYFIMLDRLRREEAQ